MNRYSWIALIHAALLTSYVEAQYTPAIPAGCDSIGTTVPSEAYCDSPLQVPQRRLVPGPPQPSCAATPTCDCNQCKTVKQRRIVVHHCPPGDGANESADRTPQAGTEPGAFLAPPQSGELTEGYRTWGLRGMSLRFPELKLSLPSIELPGVIRRSRATEMELDRAVAPFQPATVASGRNESAYRPASYSGVPATNYQAGRRPDSANENAERNPQEDRCDALDAEVAQLKAAMATIVQSQQRLLAVTTKVAESLTTPDCAAPVPAACDPVPTGPIMMIEQDSIQTPPSPAFPSGCQSLHQPPPQQYAPNPHATNRDFEYSEHQEWNQPQGLPVPNHSVPPQFRDKSSNDFRNHQQPTPSPGSRPIQSPPRGSIPIPRPSTSIENLPAPAPEPQPSPAFNANSYYPDPRSDSGMLGRARTWSAQQMHSSERRRIAERSQFDHRIHERVQHEAVVLQSAYLSPVVQAFDERRQSATSESASKQSLPPKPQRLPSF